MSELPIAAATAEFPEGILCEQVAAFTQVIAKQGTPGCGCDDYVERRSFFGTRTFMTFGQGCSGFGSYAEHQLVIVPPIQEDDWPELTAFPKEYRLTVGKYYRSVMVVTHNWSGKSGNEIQDSYRALEIARMFAARLETAVEQAVDEWPEYIDRNDWRV